MCNPTCYISRDCRINVIIRSRRSAMANYCPPRHRKFIRTIHSLFITVASYYSHFAKQAKRGRENAHQPSRGRIALDVTFNRRAYSNGKRTCSRDIIFPFDDSIPLALLSSRRLDVIPEIAVHSCTESGELVRFRTYVHNAGPFGFLLSRGFSPRDYPSAQSARGTFPGREWGYYGALAGAKTSRDRAAHTR